MFTLFNTLQLKPAPGATSAYRAVLAASDAATAYFLTAQFALPRAGGMLATNALLA